MACKRAHKLLVIDIYTAWVLEKLRQVSKHTPNMDWPEIRVFAAHGPYKRLNAKQDYFGEFRNRLFRHRVTRDELKSTPEAFLYSGKISSAPFIDEFKNAAAKVNAIYSQWQGYLDGNRNNCPGSDRIAAYRADPNVNFVYAHTSGHATIEDLKRLSEALSPRQLIPIHTEHGEDFSKFFADVRAVEDGMIIKL
jgi:ribonuclease J